MKVRNHSINPGDNKASPGEREMDSVKKAPGQTGVSSRQGFPGKAYVGRRLAGMAILTIVQSAPGGWNRGGEGQTKNG